MSLMTDIHAYTHVNICTRTQIKIFTPVIYILVGPMDGLIDRVGARVGARVGLLVGLSVGNRLTTGARVGMKEGEKEGPDGRAVGV